MPNSHPDLLTSTCDISPFPLYPRRQNYDQQFLENLRVNFYNSLPTVATDLHFGPLYKISTSSGIPLTLFSCFTDSRPDPSVKPEGFKQRRRLLLLATTDDGEITGFRSIAIDHFDRNGHDQIQTVGHISTSRRGNRCMLPIELAARDMLMRLTNIEGAPIRQVVHNENLKSLKDLVRPFVLDDKYLDNLSLEGLKKVIATLETADIKLRDELAEKVAEQERWESAYRRLGFLPLAGDSLYFDIDIPTDEKYKTSPLSIAEVDLLRVDSKNNGQKTYHNVVAQKNGDSSILQDVRRNEYLQNIKPILGNLCYPND